MKMRDFKDMIENVDDELEFIICLSDGYDNYSFEDFGLNIQKDYGCVELEIGLDDELCILTKDKG